VAVRGSRSTPGGKRGVLVRRARLTAGAVMALVLVGACRSGEPPESTLMTSSPRPTSTAGASNLPTPVGCDSSPALGRLVFSNPDDVFTTHADGSGLRQITTSPDHEFDPTWSPDGRRIAFRVDLEASADIYIIDAAGAHRRKLVEGLSPAWSPDGSRIAFADAAGTISTIRADGSDARIVPGSDQGEYPSWSPDGKRIAYSTGSDPHIIFVTNLDGTSKQRLTDGSAEDWQVDWSPKGSLLAFASNRATPRGDVYAMRSDGSEQQRLTDDGGFTPAWSPDGTSIVYSTGSQLRVLEIETRCRTDISIPGLTNLGTPDWIR
jgi:Tol biopolymer transport system component